MAQADPLARPPISDTAWHPPGPRQPSTLHGEGRVDVAVIGAGIVGLAAATAAGRAGATVAVLSADPIGDSVTGRSSAKVTSLHRARYHQIAARHGAGAARTYATANEAALRWLRDAVGDAWQDGTAITVGRDEGEHRTVQEEAHAALAAGLDVSEAAEQDSWPAEMAGAVVLTGQGRVDPVLALNRLREGLPDGVAVHEGVRATGLRHHRAGATVVHAGGTVRADHVVVATGLPVFDRGGWFALCEPQASYVVAVEVPEDRPDMLITAGEPTRSLRWATSARTGRPVALVGGEGHRTGAGGSTRRRYATLEQWARQHVPGAGDVVARWSAEDFSSPDLLPYAGPLLHVGGAAHVITGLSKWGLTAGVACALDLVEAFLHDRTTEWGRLTSTGRIPDLRGFAEITTANAGVARHLATGWAGALASRTTAPLADGQGTVGRDGLRLTARCRVDGAEHRVSAICPHLGGIVSWNDGDRTWDCPLHGSRFHADGAVRHGPATSGLPDHS